MKEILITLLVVANGALAYGQSYVEGDVIVRFKPSTHPGAQGLSGKPGRRMKLEKSFNRMNMHHYKAQDGQTTAEMIQDLKNNPDIAYIEPNYILSKTEVEGSQAYSLSQVQGFASGFGLTSADIRGEEGWGEIESTNTPIVAIIDTGVELSHDALVDALWVNGDEIPFNGRDDDGNGFVDDVNGWNFANNNNYPNDCDGHGTHVAGVVRGTTQYLFDGPPAAPVLQIMALKFLDCNGLGTTANAIKAIYYAVNNGAKILNNSWGGGEYSQALHEAIAYSYDKKTLFVAAAGNYTSNNDSYSLYPASYDVPNLISVGASTDSDTLASFSNYGTGSVHIAAPGVWVLSSYLDNEYSQMSGTSMAAPIVTGVAALMANEKPSMNGYQLRNILLSSSDSEAGLNGKIQGSRRLNSESSVVSAKAATVNPWQPDYNIFPSADNRELAGEIASSGGGCGLITTMWKGRKPVGRGGQGTNVPFGQSVAFGLMILIPILMVMYLKRFVDPQKRRQFQRYATNGRALISINGIRVDATVNSIAIGGAGIRLEEDAGVKMGDRVTVTLFNPSGQQEFEFEGQIVWNTQYEVGMSFDQPIQWFVDLFSAWDYNVSKI